MKKILLYLVWLPLTFNSNAYTKDFPFPEEWMPFLLAIRNTGDMAKFTVLADYVDEHAGKWPGLPTGNQLRAMVNVNSAYSDFGGRSGFSAETDHLFSIPFDLTEKDFRVFRNSRAVVIDASQIRDKSSYYYQASRWAHELAGQPFEPGNVDGITSVMPSAVLISNIDTFIDNATRLFERCPTIDTIKIRKNFSSEQFRKLFSLPEFQFVRHLSVESYEDPVSIPSETAATSPHFNRLQTLAIRGEADPRSALGFLRNPSTAKLKLLSFRMFDDIPSDEIANLFIGSSPKVDLILEINGPVRASPLTERGFQILTTSNTSFRGLILDHLPRSADLAEALSKKSFSRLQYLDVTNRVSVNPAPDDESTRQRLTRAIFGLPLLKGASLQSNYVSLNWAGLLANNPASKTLAGFQIFRDRTVDCRAENERWRPDTLVDMTATLSTVSLPELKTLDIVVPTGIHRRIMSDIAKNFTVSPWFHQLTTLIVPPEMKFYLRSHFLDTSIPHKHCIWLDRILNNVYRSHPGDDL